MQSIVQQRQLIKELEEYKRKNERLSEADDAAECGDGHAAESAKGDVSAEATTASSPPNGTA